MGRPKCGTNESHSKEEKSALVKRNIAGESLLRLQRETGCQKKVIQQIYACVQRENLNHSVKDLCETYYAADIHSHYPSQGYRAVNDTLLNGRFKDVMRSHFRYRKCDDLNKAVADTVYYFNYIRPVRKLKRKPPAQYRIELAA